MLEIELTEILNFRFIDRNKAAGDTFFFYNNEKVKAELIFYLQGDTCLSIRVGRHDKKVTTKDLESYISKNINQLRKMVKSDIEKIRKERLAKLQSQQ